MLKVGGFNVGFAQNNSIFVDLRLDRFEIMGPQGVTYYQGVLTNSFFNVFTRFSKNSCCDTAL